MRQAIQVLLFFVSFHSPCWAEETISAPFSSEELGQFPKTYKGKAIIPRPFAAYEDSSEVMREGKRFHVHLGMGLLAYDANIGYFYNPDTTLNMNFTYQKDTITGISRIVSATVGRFVENSLYVRGGLAGRRGDDINYVNSFLETDTGVFASDDLGAEFAIGNQWQWQNLTIGGEWFAIYIPLVVKGEREFDFQFRASMINVGLSF